MEQNNLEQAQKLDEYIKTVKDQEIKGILLKLKNEIRREDVDSRMVESIVTSLKDKNEDVANAVLAIIS